MNPWACVGILFLWFGLAACSEPLDTLNNDRNYSDTANISKPKAEPAELAATPVQPMVPAIIFLQYLNQQAPQLLCQQDPGVACLNMPTELCQASVAASAERCGPTLLEQWPAEFAETEANAIFYSQSYRNCMLADWVNEFGLQPERLAACGIELN